MAGASSMCGDPACGGTGLSPSDGCAKAPCDMHNRAFGPEVGSIKATPCAADLNTMRKTQNAFCARGPFERVRWLERRKQDHLKGDPMKLYFLPNTRAVRSAWLLNELGLEFELHRFEKLGDPAMRAPEFLKISPNGRIPVLEDGDIRLFESVAIAQYLAAKYDDGTLVPRIESPEFPMYLQWLHYAEGMIMPPMNSYVVETILLPPERQSEVHAKRALKVMSGALRAADAHLEGREYLAGAFSVADTITGHACLMSSRFGVDFSDMPNLQAYIDRLQARPAFEKALAL